MARAGGFQRLIMMEGPGHLAHEEALDEVVIDVSHAHIWDISSVTALDMVVLKFRREGAETVIIGLNEASETIMDALAVHDEPGALDRLLGH